MHDLQWSGFVIVGIGIRNFKGIREIVSLPLSRFHVLVGANGSGKSSFLEAIDLIRDCLRDSPRMAVAARPIADFKDLTWLRKGGAVEIDLVMDLSGQLPALTGHVLLYRLAIEQNSRSGVVVKYESLSRLEAGDSVCHLADLRKVGGGKAIVSQRKGVSVYAREADGRDGEARVCDSFEFGAERLALAQTPADRNLYPTANAVRDFLMQGVRYIRINSASMRLPCSAAQPTNLAFDGSNLPRVVRHLLGKRRGRGPYWAQAGSSLGEWMAHVRYALPDVRNVGWGRRSPDNAEYLLLRYENGLEVPNWLLSDGTLRMLALTIPAFLPEEAAIYMVEEPENGVHPKALEIIMQSLSFIPGAQSLVVTHSPLVVQSCRKEDLLCFSHSDFGVQAIPGSRHPALAGWDGMPDLDTVFAAGLLE